MNDMPTPHEALALLSAHEHALLAANRAYCLTCGAASQDAILACLQHMNDFINLHGFPGIPCTLEEREAGCLDAMPVPAYAMGARVRFTPPVIAVPSAIPYRITALQEPTPENLR